MVIILLTITTTTTCKKNIVGSEPHYYFVISYVMTKLAESRDTMEESYIKPSFENTCFEIFEWLFRMIIILIKYYILFHKYTKCIQLWYLIIL